MNSETGPWRSVQALMISALPKRASGQDDIARPTLDQGLRTANTDTLRDRVRDFGSSWSEWLVAQVPMREAQAAMEGAGQPEQPR